MKNVYFLSDAHLGSLAIDHGRTQERRLVRFLDSIKTKAAAIYLLGDMFDFWDEYRYVVPKGYTRFLGKISELTDMGVEVHFFTGNHAEYHKPSDDWELINFKGALQVVKYIYSVVGTLDKQSKLAFTKTKEVTSNKSTFKVTLGIMLDYL